MGSLRPTYLRFDYWSFIELITMAHVCCLCIDLPCELALPNANLNLQAGWDQFLQSDRECRLCEQSRNAESKSIRIYDGLCRGTDGRIRFQRNSTVQSLSVFTYCVGFTDSFSSGCYGGLQIPKFITAKPRLILAQISSAIARGIGTVLTVVAAGQLM